VRYLNWISILILADLLAFLLIFPAKNYYKQGKRFWGNRRIMKKEFEALGLEWRG